MLSKMPLSKRPKNAFIDFSQQKTLNVAAALLRQNESFIASIFVS